MKFTIQAIASVAILLATSSVNANLENDSLGQKASHQRRHSHLSAEKRDELIKREISQAPISDIIKRDLEAMDPDDYTLFPRAAGDGIKFSAGGKAHDKSETWVNGHGPGRGNCHGSNTAITFDDGAYTWHKELSDQFDAYGYKANFAVNGLNWACIYDEANVKNIKAADKAGHLHFSHTWSHRNLTDGLTAKELDDQVVFLEEALWKIIGKVPAYLRPPYGETNRTILEYLHKKHDVTVVQWSDDAGDAAGESYHDSISMYKKFKKGENHVILNHEVKDDTVHKVIPFALKHFKNQGVKPVTLDKCLKGSPAPYKLVGKPQKRDSTWTCDGKPQPGQG